MALDLNPFDEGGVFGSGDAEDAKKKEREAEELWANLRGKTEQIAGSDTLNWGTDITPYFAGPELEAANREAVRRGTHPEPGVSSWFSDTSAFEDRGPSAYETMGPSAYSEMDPSAFGDLGFNEESLDAMGGSSDYFRDIMSDPTDDIAEADYQRRAAMAEQSRKANTDAALQQLEMRGQGAASDALLAELTGAQGAASDLYQAGLDANAVAQARRDSAAGSRADISERMGRGMLDADTQRAQGLDTYGTNRAAGLDTYGTNRAAGLDTYGQTQAQGLDDFSGRQNDANDEWTRGLIDDWYNVDEWNANEQSGVNEGNQTEQSGVNRANFDRANSIGDANVATKNQTAQWNAGSEQRAFNNDLAVTQGQTGQLGSSASGLREGAVYPFQDIVLPTGAAGVKAGKKAGGVPEDED